MSIKSFLGKQLAKLIVLQTHKWSGNPIKTQRKFLTTLLERLRIQLLEETIIFHRLKATKILKRRCQLEIMRAQGLC